MSDKIGTMIIDIIQMIEREECAKIVESYAESDMGVTHPETLKNLVIDIRNKASHTPYGTK